MRKFLFSISVVITFLHADNLFAQICDSITPAFTVNLSGNPFGSWISPSGTRDGYCCSASGSDVCIEFIITLDTAATGINFDIASGAVPPGALYYQVNCGPPVMVGQPICLSGAGPHLLTFCKPGNNPNSYSITSFAQPTITSNISGVASSQCPAILSVQGLVETSVSWTSIPTSTLYNSYLNCISGCDSVSVAPSGSFPSYVDYMVCGNSGAVCASATMCDTVRVYFISDVTVAVSPNNITLCNGVSTTVLSAVASGGSGSYQYVWSNGQTSQNITAGAGTYSVTVSDTAVCSTGADNATINVLPPIVANAGNDVTICANQAIVNLNGNIQTATAAIWLGGSGTFNPNNASLNAVYIPSASEIANGFAELILETTANQGCPAGHDTIHIIIVQPPSPSVSGNTLTCVNSTTVYSAGLVAGCSYTWSVTGGVINGASNSNSVSITWGNTNSGTVTVTLTNSAGCFATATQNVSLVVQPNPIIAGINSACQYSSAFYSVNSLPGSGYYWIVNNGTIVGSNSNSAIQVNWSSNGNGSVTVTETNSFGCTQSFTMPVTVFQQPVPSISGSSVACVSNSPENYSSTFYPNATYLWSVNGGTMISTSQNNTIQVIWNSNGSNSVSLTVSNSSTGCDSTMVFPVEVGSLTPLSAQATGLNGCPPLSVVFSGNAPAPGQTYSWTFGDQWYSSSANPSHIYKEPGVYNLLVVTQHGSGCMDSASATIHVYDMPQASFNYNFENSVYMIGESNLELTNTTVGGTSYLWTFGTGDTSNVFEPKNTYEHPGDYWIQLFAINAAGCTDIISKEIHVRNREYIHVPSAFSPNGDHTNDYFFMLTTNIESAHVSIFNRWGEFFFSSDDKNFRWDGTCNGRPAELGVYGYRIQAVGEGGKEYTVLGTVTLLR